ncbi:glycosyl hydrolase [Cohnella sp. CIP 111063]|uniref:Gfo/Idh/MocA family protein n=1 Tax=unclassified Cohnella TaxID=2636738 RepID=UPI000B8C679C|nr:MULTISPECIES: Gfo/Idh/MocA family oxidoreductase [unclassified Cohnella]OXS58265.1 glycosyl hydrolase [Cohnella sp. CIP 111063]PRX71539.1 putative dehydrogenase [Cohnella sp. SGD-V74]
MKEKVIIGMIGLGARGASLLEMIVRNAKDVEVAAVCDLYEDRREAAADLVEKAGGKRPVAVARYEDVLALADIDAVVIGASWAAHMDIAIAAMEAGKYVASEVGGAYSVQECWKLVETYERTKTPVMLMENCCYGREELMVLNMVKQGVFGEIVHCAGGYHHDLRGEIAGGEENRHYRLNEYIHRNCENYPTHEIGPIARVLDINRGNRMMSLVSVASKASGMKDYIKREKGAEHPLANVEFAQGDIVTTVIRCARGETITITLDTTLPRSYSRGFTVRGTRGMYMEDNQSIFIDGQHDEHHFDWKGQWGNAESYFEQYDHPIWKKFVEDGVKGGHGGMDWLVFEDFFDCVKNGKPTPIDVYDMAVWMSISALSEESIALGGHPVAFPDFTNGKWTTRR